MWQTASGNFRCTEDEGLLNYGRLRFHGESADVPPPVLSEIDGNFILGRSPFRAVLEVTAPHAPGTACSEVAEVLTINGISWSIQRGQEILRRDDANYALGTYAVGDMLTTTWLFEVIHIESTVGATREGRAVLEITGTPDPKMHMAAPWLVVLSATRVRIVWDLERGVVLEFQSDIEGRLAYRTELTNVEFDVELQASDFKVRGGSAADMLHWRLS